MLYFFEELIIDVSVILLSMLHLSTLHKLISSFRISNLSLLTKQKQHFTHNNTNSQLDATITNFY